MADKCCAGVNKDGSPCRRPPLQGSARCHWHPEKRELPFVLRVADPDQETPAPMTGLGVRQGESFSEAGVYCVAWCAAILGGLQVRMGRPDGIPMMAREPRFTFETTEGSCTIPTAALVVWRKDRIEVSLGAGAFWGAAEPIEATLRTRRSLITPSLIGQELGEQEVYESCDGGEAKIRLRDDSTDPHLGFFLWGGQFLIAASPEVPRQQTQFLGLSLPHLDVINLPPAEWETLTGQAATVGQAEAAPALISSVPHDLALMTSEEPRILIEAIANGRTGKGWQPAQDGATRVFRPRPNGHEVRLRVYHAAEEWGPDELSRRLDSTLVEWGLDAAFLAAVAISTLAEGTRLNATGVASGALTPVADLTVDDLLRGLGKKCDSRKERDDWRRWVRRRMLEISGAQVVGQRRGTYRRRDTGEVMDTYQEEVLLMAIDAETTWLGNQPSFDGSGVPIRMRIHGGGLFREIARNPALLQYLGNLRALAEIPGGKAGGQWARAIGLAFAQGVREQATKAQPKQAFTRKELLTRFPPDPSAAEILGGNDPARALTYWRDAKAELVRIGWWDSFDEPQKPSARYGWAPEWLEQEICPTPGLLLASPLPQLAASADEARRKVKQGRNRKRPLV
jgi:hypothetical protein